MENEFIVSGPLPDGAAPPALPEARFKFTGSAGEFFSIWIVNLCLSIITLGVYSAWAKVRTERYFYGNTWIAGAPFEYLADPLKIFWGRMIAVVIFAAVLISSNLWPLVNALLVVLLFIAAPWIIVRSLRFHAWNSAWQGLRFRFDGPTKAAYNKFLLLALLVIISLGLAYPWVKAQQRRYVINHHGYGGKRFNLNVLTSDFYVIYLIAAGVAIGLYFGILFVLVLGAGGAKWFATGSMIGLIAGGLLVVIAVVIGIALYFALLALPVFVQARLFNLCWNHTKLGEHRFRADMRARELIKIFLVNVVAIVFSLGMAIPWAMVRLARYRAEHLTLLPAGDLNQFVADSIAQKNAVGEELGDIFDIDVGL